MEHRYKFEVSTDNIPYIMVDERYTIYLDTGVCYDTIEAKDIPDYVFNLRDYYMAETKRDTLTEIIEKYCQ